MGVLELIQQKAFLGKEFLTWLWYRAETGPRIDLGRSRHCEIEFLGPLTLDAHFGDARTTALRGASPSTSPEAAAALLEGKKVRRAGLKLSANGVDWIVTLDGENFSISSLNLPRPGRLPFEEALRLRLDYTLEFEALFSELFNRFLELRLDSRDWAAQIKKIQAWVGDK